MKSDLPKVLHRLSDKPLVGHVFDTARQLQPTKLIGVYGHGGTIVPQTMASPDLLWALQDPPRGTGHAVAQAVELLDNAVPTLVLYGDVPLTKTSTLERLMAAAQASNGQPKLAILTVKVEDPAGYGRIVRNAQGAITSIVEHKDATAEQRQINEINTGIMVIPTQSLKTWLSQLSNNNAQGEYYLTDVVGFAVRDGVEVVHAEPDAEWETAGVNSKVQLAELERILQLNQAKALMEAGVMLADPARIDIRGTLVCGTDVEIDVGCVFEGQVSLGNKVKIGPYCVLKNTSIGDQTELSAFSHLESAQVGARASIGPYARLRPGAELADETHVGNFVELKNTVLGHGSKANHLSYLGDARIGQRVNVGAGTITCNYDGANKHLTVIEDDAFIGSDSQLVAPVTVRAGATIAAGTTLTKEAPANALTLSRVKQETKASWKRPVKAAKKSSN